MLRVWLDTDIGSDVDDAVALLCALRHPRVHLVGVSTVWRRVEIREWLAREMVTRAGADDVHILPGAMAPMAATTHGVESLPSHSRLAPQTTPPDPADDDERIERVAHTMASLPEPFHLVAVGPLTNIAHLVRRHSQAVDRWQAITCMAGRLEGEPEYNVACDPAAARIVLQALGPTLVGIEACSDVLSREETEAVLDESDAASAFLLDCYREYRANAGLHGDPEHGPLTLFDAITLLSLVEPKAFEFQGVRVRVEKNGRLRLTDDGSPVTYATKSDWSELRPTIAGLLRTGSPSL
jgi:inosine-uridine nucleoside N-ribohydrolase